MSRRCESSGKKPKKGYKYARRGLAKKKGGVGRKITGKTLRVFRPNLQKVKVLLPDGTVRRMKLATSVIKKGVIEVELGGRRRQVPLVKAPRGRASGWPSSPGRE